MNIILHKAKHVTTMILLVFVCSTLHAETIKEITVSNDNPYTDHVSLREDTKDMDLMAKFVFNENTNTLTLTLVSYRSLFVFQTDTKYKQAFKGFLFLPSRSLKPDKLPFVVTADKGVKYVISKEYHKSLPKSRRNYTFHTWMQCSQELQPVPANFKMVNEYIKQDFAINGQAEFVTVTLRDIMMLDPASTKKNVTNKYLIRWGKDINTVYHINIQRDPCFGKDQEIAASANALKSIKTGYENFKKNFPNTVFDDKDTFENFKQMKMLLATQFQAVKDSSKCTQICTNYNEYNLYVDSINNYRGVLRQLKVNIPERKPQGGSGLAVDSDGKADKATFIQTQARRIDYAVSQWLYTKDPAERAGLKNDCENIISIVKRSLAAGGGGDRLKRAVAIFNQAVGYYRKTCK